MLFKKPNLLKSIIVVSFLLVLVPVAVSAQQKFFVDSTYDFYGREIIFASLKKTFPNAYFFVDDDFFNSLERNSQNQILDNLEQLGSEFTLKIYPQLTGFWGQEPKPGIDGDEKITILFHPMREKVGGYFNSGDEYLKIQNPKSNQREMFYLNSKNIPNPLIKALMAHEFTHLIVFNQKEKISGISEETWLNEAYAEYSITYLGYNEPYQGSNLEKRVSDFLSSPSDSLTFWQNKISDYGVINLFIHYLIDHYGRNILNDALHSKKAGILSINEALVKNGFKEDFSKVFTDFTIAVLINNCSAGEKYCFKSSNLAVLRLLPQSHFLPLAGITTLETTYSSEDWAGNWFKFLGGHSDLKIVFSGNKLNKFVIPYILENSKREQEVKFLNLDKNGQGEIIVPKFNNEIISITLLPSVQSKISEFDGLSQKISFTFKVSLGNFSVEDIIKELLEKIEILKKQIAETQAKIDELSKASIGGCQIINNLYFGLKNNNEVKCLQTFLKSQDSQIYPEGLITGNFLDLTLKAVIRFQEKYAGEILRPLGLEKGTGFVGLATRAKINQLLK